jgi:hypothetical protein
MLDRIDPMAEPLTEDDRAELVAYLDGELAGDAQRRVEARLNADPAARTEADTLKRAWDLLDYLPRSEPSTDFTERTIDRISSLSIAAASHASRSATAALAPPWYRRRPMILAVWAAAVLLAVGAGYLLPLKPRAVAEADPDTDPLMAEKPRQIEYLPLYLAAENLDYLLALDQSDLFSDDGTGRGSEERRPIRRATDSDHRDRQKLYLTAYRRLSPATQEQLRQVDQDVHEEDPVTGGRLFGVMERYALWLSRLPDADRQHIQAAAGGTERLHVVRDILEKQWLDGLPPARKERLAKTPDIERPKLLEQWHREERERQQDRMFALRAFEEMMIPGQPDRFRQDLQRFVKAELEPKLNQKEKSRLQAAMGKGQQTRNYLHQIWVLSEPRGLKPPGPPEIWNQFRERKPSKPPE